MKPVLILPLLATAITGLLMVYVVGVPVAAILSALTEWLKGMQGTSAVLLGLVLGGMMAVDMGGPVNKAAYASSAALIASGITAPMAAVMIGGMTPPLGIALATRLFPPASRNPSARPAVRPPCWARPSSPKGRSPSRRPIRFG